MLRKNYQGAFNEAASKAISKHDPSSFRRIPKNAKTVQTPLAYSIAYSSPYPDVQLPHSLQKVTTKFLDETVSTSASFLYHLLQKLRQDYYSVRLFVKECLRKDPGPPSLNDVSITAKLHFLLTPMCNWCGKIFGKIYQNPRTGKKYRPIKAKHHLHFLKVIFPTK